MKTSRRFFAFVMALVMALSLLPATVGAEELPVIPNIAINDGVVTWDAVDGAAEYSWSVGGGGGKVSSTEPLSVDLKDKLASFGYESDTYTFTIYARDAERTRLSQDWSCEYAYTSKGKLPAPTNLRWEDGLAKWDAVEHAQIYFVELFEEGDDSRLSYQYTTTNECSFSVENGVKYEFRVMAEASYGVHYEGYEDSDFSARSAAAVVRYAPKEDIANVKFTDGVLTWDAYDGAAGYYVSIGTAGKYVEASAERSVDMRAFAASHSLSNGCYDVTLVAVDDLIYNGGIEISNKWKSPFKYLYLVGDERTEVASFTGTSDMVAPTYGGEVKTVYNFTFEGGMARVPDSMGYWEKHDGAEWQRYNGDAFTEGVYRYTNQLRIDSSSGYGSTHKLAPVFSVTIDGKAWEQTTDSFGDLTYTYAYMASPAFEVEWTPLPLVFTDSSLFDIGENYVGQPIPSYSVASAVVGGTPEYTFSKTAGAEWVNVSADGTVSGTPTASGNNVAVTIRVTDGAGLYEEIQVLVGFTQPDPATRETVRYIVGTSDMEVPVLGGTVETVYDFTFTVGDMVNVPDSMGDWEKYNGEEWQRYNGDTFTEGVYRYTNQVRIDGSAGHTHKLHEALQVTIDGKLWEQTRDTYVANTYSYAYVASPAFVVSAAPAVDGVTRLAGANRFDTAFKSADALKEVMGVDKFPAAIVTSGMNFADALAGSYLAAEMDAPILLTDNDNMADVIDYILENVEEGGVVYALGGTTIVSDTLRAVEDEGYTFKRLAGASRFETNLLILEEAGIESGDPVLVCTAYNFADSLSASALGMPILLVDDTVSAAQMAFLEENADGEFVLVGGTGAVKPAVEEQLRATGRDVVRLAGASRFDTSVLTAIEAFGSTGVDYAVLAYGYNFPDGLCAGPLAYALGAPLILTANGDEGPATVYANNAGIESGFVLGGPSLIDDGVVYRIFSMGAGEDIQ